MTTNQPDDPILPRPFTGAHWSTIYLSSEAAQHLEQRYTFDLMGERKSIVTDGHLTATQIQTLPDGWVRALVQYEHYNANDDPQNGVYEVDLLLPGSQVVAIDQHYPPIDLTPDADRRKQLDASWPDASRMT